MKIIFILLAVTLLIVPVQAQNGESDKDTKTNKSLVSVPVIVSDREGHYIPGLKKEDFTVLQDGVKQNITFFAKYDEPLNIALLIDTSGSTEDVSKKIKNAARELINLLNPNDRCLLATFDNQVKILSPFTSDHKKLKTSLDKIKSADLGGTLMYRAVEQISRNSFADAEGRKVIILLTDGKDFGSPLTKEELLGQFEESDILIYTVFYRTGTTPVDPISGKRKKTKKSRKKKNVIIPTGPIYVPTEAELAQQEKADEAEATDVLKKMSDATAGRFYMSDSENLSGVFKKMAGELREQYRLGFNPKDAADDAATHDIIIKVARPDAVVRFRGKFRAKQL
jgi:VWFA-related protein